MNLDVDKWNPFKFLRRSSQERRGEPAQQNQSAGAGLPAGWPAWPLPLPLVTDPFRLMRELARDPAAGSAPLERWFGDYSPSLFQPRVDVADEGEALRISAELPGMQRDDVEILAEDGALVLRGEKKLESEREEQGVYRVERAFGSFQRVVPLPDGVDLDHAEAKFDKGVLTLRLPKTAAKKDGERKIEIK